jgi:hypothetical protein
MCLLPLGGSYLCLAPEVCHSKVHIAGGMASAVHASAVVQREKDEAQPSVRQPGRGHKAYIQQIWDLATLMPASSGALD